MRKLIGVVCVLGLGACHRGNPNPPLPAGTQVGAATPTAVVEVIMAAAKGGDIQAFSTVWGDSLGPVRDRMDRTQLEQRAAIMLLCLRNDRYTIVSEGPGQQGSRTVAVQLTRNGVSRSTNFTMINPQNRWFMYTAPSLETDLYDICKQR